MSKLSVVLTLMAAIAFASPQTEEVGDATTCFACTTIAGYAKNFLLNNENVTVVYDEIVKTVCDPFLPEYKCTGVVDQLAEIGYNQLAEHYADAYFLCNLVGQCTTPSFSRQNFTEWSDDLLSSKPSVVDPFFTDSANNFKFGQISDINLDNSYKEGTPATCTNEPCCHDTSTPVGSNSRTAGKWGDYNCDLPVDTFNAGVAAMKSIENLDFLIWTGNTAPHEIWNQTESVRMDLIEQATEEIENRFANIPVYPVIGSWDTSPVHQYSFKPRSFADRNTFNKFLSNEWRYLIKDNDALKQIENYGFYSLWHKADELKIIGMNMMACNYLNLNLFYNVTDPADQLGWLSAELKDAEDKNAGVYIIGSTPPGDSSCLSDWSMRYNAIIDRYQNTVRGQFFGSTSRDQVILNRSVKGSSPTGTIFVAPSMSSYNKANPSFRIYEADGGSFYPTNYYQYRMDLDKANQNPTVTPTWDNAYNFKSTYLVGSLTPSKLLSWVEDMRNDELASLKYLYNQATYGPSKPLSCDTQCMESNACDMAFGVYDDQIACRNMTSSPLVSGLRFAYGSWYIKDSS